MIDALSAAISRHAHTLPLVGELNTGALRFTKFCQRIVGPETKVLFLVTHQGVPLCIIKVMRSKEWSNMLRREKEVQEHIKPYSTCRAPAVYFEGEIDGLYIYAEEVMHGLPLSREDALRYERAVVEFMASLPRSGMSSAHNLAMLLGPLVPTEASQLTELLEGLRNSEAQIEQGLTHGDLGTPNILKEQSGLCVIDWAHTGERPFALLDAVYYMARLRRVGSLPEWKAHAESLFISYTNVSMETASALFRIYLFLALLKKKYPEHYEMAIGSFQSL